jgi:dienelactone hydrolase
MKRVLLALALLAIAVPQAVAQAVRTEVIDGRNTVRMIPAKPRAIIYLFHGSGGSEGFATNPTTVKTLEAFVKAGYGYAASASLQRTDPMRWDLSSGDPKTNPDLAWMLALHKKLVAAGEISATTPVFTMGMSNGGGMANLFGSVAKIEGLPVKGVADYMGPFPAPMAAMLQAGKLPPPTFVVAAEHDGLVNAQNVLANAEKVKAAGQTVETHLATEAVLKRDAFMSIEGVDAAASSAIFDDLVTRKLIDASGKRLVFAGQGTFPREDLAKLLTLLPAGANQRAIHRVLVSTWAGHMMRSDYAAQQFAFFEAALKH